MTDITQSFSVSKMKNQFESYEIVNKVLISKNNNNNIFELYVDNYNEKFEKKLENHLELFYPVIQKDKTRKNNKYYKVEISGLINDL